MAYNIVCHGNSITEGTGAETTYPTQLDTLLGGAHVVYNEGTGGITTPALVDNFASEVQAHYAEGEDNIVVFWESSNFFSIGYAVETEKANLLEYSELCIANGWRLIICNVIQRGIVNALSSLEEWRPKVAELNEWLSYNWHSFAHAYCNFHDLNSAFSTPFEGNGDATYFVDQAHLTTVGYGLIAAEVQAAISRINTSYEVVAPSGATKLIADYRLANGKTATIYDNNGQALSYVLSEGTPAITTNPTSMAAYVSS